MADLKKYGIESVVLQNGMRVIVKYLQSGGISGSVIVRCGSVYETKGVNNGISHFLEHLIYYSGIRGSRRSSPFYKIEKTGANIDPGTARPWTEYSFNFLQQSWRRNFRILLDAIGEADFSKSIFLREQRVIANEKIDETNVLNEIVDRRIFPQHSMGLSIDGETKIVNALTSRRVKNWHRRFYRPERTTIVIVGNTSVKEVVSIIRRTALWRMSDIPATPTKEPPPAIIKWDAQTEVKASGANKLRIIFSAPTAPRDIIFFLLIIEIINDLSVVAMRWKVIHDFGLHGGINIDEGENVELGGFCSYAAIDIWAPSHKALKGMERAFFSWVKKVNENGLNQDIFLRIYNQHLDKKRLGVNDECWWAELLVSMVQSGYLSALDLCIDPEVLGAAEIKKEVERVFRYTVGGKCIIFRSLMK